jgi:hypothetical protein
VADPQAGDAAGGEPAVQALTADGRDLQVDPRDLYDMLELDKRTDRILPNGWCLLPPRQACDKGNARTDAITREQEPRS